VVVWRKWPTFMVFIDMRAIRWRGMGMVPMMAMVCGDVCVRRTRCHRAGWYVWADLQIVAIKKWAMHRRFEVKKWARLSEGGGPLRTHPFSPYQPRSEFIRCCVACTFTRGCMFGVPYVWAKLSVGGIYWPLMEVYDLISVVLSGVIQHVGSL
jgi:hypothetical protein